MKLARALATALVSAGVFAASAWLLKVHPLPLAMHAALALMGGTACLLFLASGSVGAAVALITGALGLTGPLVLAGGLVALLGTRAGVAASLVPIGLLLFGHGMGALSRTGEEGPRSTAPRWALAASALAALLAGLASLPLQIPFAAFGAATLTGAGLASSLLADSTPERLRAQLARGGVVVPLVLLLVLSAMQATFPTYSAALHPVYLRFVGAVFFFFGYCEGRYSPVR